MAKRIVWTIDAQENKDSILKYWNHHNQSNSYSIKLNTLFKKVISLISEMPNTGRKTNVEGVRAKLIKNYLIFYEEIQETIFILSIWDTRRDPKDLPYQ